MLHPHVHVPYHRIEDYLTFIKANRINLEIFISSESLDGIKGTGWYVTDYASSDRKKAMESESKPSPAAETKPQKKKEKKSKAVAGK